MNEEWELKPGDTVDRWTLAERLGRGGNGEVWLADRPDLGRAALKLLKLKFQGEEHKRYLRFCDEATMHERLAARHQGVLPFVGCSLPENPSRRAPAWMATRVATKAQDALKGRPLREAIQSVSIVADTLATLHEQGVSHRDIKPDNLFRYEDRWVIGDFGLVDYPDKDSLTDTGERLGPYHYLAPEMQIEANRSDGRKADVYSLGKTLWVLATEQNIPPPGELRADNIQMSIRAYAADPRSHQLDLLIERATKHDPAHRPTMTEFATELRAWLTTPEVISNPDLSDAFARLQALTPPALRSADDRAKLKQRAKQLDQELRAGLVPIAQKLASTGLSDGSVGTFAPADNNFAQRLADGYLSGTNLYCSATLPVRFGMAQLSCIVIWRYYSDGTAQFCGGYRVGVVGMMNERFIGVNNWSVNLGSARQSLAVSELFISLNEHLEEALTTLAEIVEKMRPAQ